MSRASRWALVVVGLAACTPEIAPGAYLCGPEQACPDGQACNGVDNTCVLPGAVEPFACPAGTETEPNDGLALAQPVGTLTCASRVVEILGCTPEGDAEDWFSFDVPASCTTVTLEARLAYPIAFELLDLELRAADGSTLETGNDCVATAADGLDRRCLEVAVTPGVSYALRVNRTGLGDCAGACAHNRYTLDVQLATP